MPALIPVNAVQYLLLLVLVISFDIFIKALKPSLCFQDKKRNGDYCGDFSTPCEILLSTLNMVHLTFPLIQGSCCCLTLFF